METPRLLTVSGCVHIRRWHSLDRFPQLVRVQLVNGLSLNFSNGWRWHHVHRHGAKKTILSHTPRPRVHWENNLDFDHFHGTNFSILWSLLTLARLKRTIVRTGCLLVWEISLRHETFSPIYQCLVLCGVFDIYLCIIEPRLIRYLTRWSYLRHHCWFSPVLSSRRENRTDDNLAKAKRITRWLADKARCLVSMTKRANPLEKV